MKEIAVSSLGEFLAGYKAHFPDPPDTNGVTSDVIFRGQSSSRFDLLTTLERTSRRELALSDYMRTISRIRDEVHAATGRAFDRVPIDIRKLDDLLQNSSAMAYMFYLRQFGFPSPLLDWTQSPYVAAYFAFRDAVPDGDVVIFCYREYCGEGKTWCSGEARIEEISPGIGGISRHYSQQVRYTICVKEVGGDLRLGQHDDQGSQNAIVKFVLPVRIRSDVMGQLSLMNVNDFTLFGTEEALLRSLAEKNALGPFVSGGEREV